MTNERLREVVSTLRVRNTLDRPERRHHTLAPQGDGAEVMNAER